MDANTKAGFRIEAQQRYQDLVIAALGYKIPHAGSAEGMIEIARRIDAGPLESANGWRTEPPFPGAGEPPEEMPKGWRMICACKFFVGDEPVGMIFMTLVGGRPVALVVNPADFPIPKEYSPILVR